MPINRGLNSFWLRTLLSPRRRERQGCDSRTVWRF